MPANTRERSDALQAAARGLITARGLDIAGAVPIKALAPAFAEAQACHIDTAKRHLAKAVRRMRGELVAEWGGRRDGAGRPPKPKD